MPSQTSKFLATFKPKGDAGQLIVDEIPVDERGIRTDQRKTILTATLDTFEIEAVRKYLPTVGFTIVNRSLHPVGHGKNFFFDMHLERV